MLSSPDRDDDLLRERLRALHDAWPGDPADDDPLRAARRTAGMTGAADIPPAHRRAAPLLLPRDPRPPRRQRDRTPLRPARPPAAPPADPPGAPPRDLP
ncbi:hypothetical protein [Clavibacter zhangzhiyongii]|uniref:hypothetical protein n=1 Tax=Clavibacter zhangzhiyongii TaxID=2768071 RepID=UPI0039DF401B